MKNNGMIFIVGGAIGFIAGYFVGKRRTERIKEEEIQSILEECYGKRDSKKEEKETVNVVEEHKDESEEDSEDEGDGELPPPLVEAYKLPALYLNEVGKNPSKSANIEIIDQDDFGMYEDDNGLPYEKAFLYYYKDGVLASDDNEIIYDIDNTIGKDSLKHLKNMDEIWIRNHDLELDYNIMKSLLTYEELKQREATYELE